MVACRIDPLFMDDIVYGWKTQVRRTGSKSLYQPASVRDIRIRRTRRIDGVQTVRTDRPDRTEGSRSLSALQRLGGIISQLIQETEDQLAESRKNIEKLETRLEMLQRLRDIQKSVE